MQILERQQFAIGTRYSAGGAMSMSGSGVEGLHVHLQLQRQRVTCARTRTVARQTHCIDAARHMCSLDQVATYSYTYLSTLIGEGLIEAGTAWQLYKIEKTERGLAVQGGQKAPFEVAPQNMYKTLKPGTFKAFISLEHRQTTIRKSPQENSQIFY